MVVLDESLEVLQLFQNVGDVELLSHAGGRELEEGGGEIGRERGRERRSDVLVDKLVVVVVDVFEDEEFVGKREVGG